MDHPVLIATATQAFGILIEQTLEDSGRYQATLVDSAKKALDLSCRTKFDLYILDHNLPDMSLVEIVWALREAKVPGRLMVVPPNNEISNPALISVAPDGYLTKPFYLPDLLDMVDKVVEASPGSLAPSPPSPERVDAPIRPALSRRVPEWLGDVDMAAQHLTRLSLELAAQAALIVHNHQLWAYAGELPQPAAQELTEIVAHHWGNNGGLDLARFVRLRSIGKEYMLYATGMAGGMVLALVFDTETPFSKIRSQASWLARKLAAPPNSETAANQDPAEAVAAEPGQEEPRRPGPPLFDAVPPPTPQIEKQWAGGRTKLEPPPLHETRLPSMDLSETDASRRQGPAPGGMPSSNEPVNQPETADSPPAGYGLPGESAQTPSEVAGPGPRQPAAYSQTAAAGPAVEPGYMSGPAAGQGLPGLSVEQAGILFDLMLETASPAICSLNFACLLVPRLPNQHLTGELASSLSTWMPQLCLAFGWRLEHLSVRPDYLQWVNSALPSTSPESIVQLVRQHTSQRIFALYPDLVQENPSGDFWAPGYLLVASAQPLPAQLIQEFIRQTRQRQGVSQPGLKKV